MSRVACRRTDRAGTFRRAGRDAAETTDGRAPRWATTTCVAANRPGLPTRRRRVRRANRRLPEGPWRRRHHTGRQSFGGSPLPKRY